MRYVPSTTLRSMVVYGASGLAFVGANLLLARVLSTEHYALLTLLVALIRWVTTSRRSAWMPS